VAYTNLLCGLRHMLADMKKLLGGYAGR